MQGASLGRREREITVEVLGLPRAKGKNPPGGRLVLDWVGQEDYFPCPVQVTVGCGS